MRRLFFLIIAALTCIASQAQEDNTRLSLGVDVPAADSIQHTTSGDKPMTHLQAKETDFDSPLLHSYSLPYRRGVGGEAPYFYPSYTLPPLHSGLNFTLGASVFTQFGKNAWHGAGFSQSLSALYVMPLNNRLSVAVGGYLTNLMWHHDNFHTAGLSALVDYRFDEHWEGYLYAHKQLTENRFMPMPLYDMGLAGDIVGAGVTYHFSPSFSIGVSVERRWMPDNYPFQR